ncbi:DivIVA domain-containing protein [Micromonospora sp. NPDC048871]|uniref:DivIVA domain-containing protein n=1 Tax=Micromonospora sp. NPDC048871 TaxID=3364259 RepID=UPI0037207493
MERSTDTPTGPAGDGLSRGSGGSADGTTESGGIYRTTQRLLTPVEVRWQRFPMTRFGRRGLDPEAVATFLRRVEADLDALYREIVAARDEARCHQEALGDLRAERWSPHEPWGQRRRGEYRRAPLWPPYSSRQHGSHGRPGNGRGDD